MKTCNKCKIEKELNEFFKDKNNITDGHYSICKVCKKTGSMQWRKKNKKRYNENMRLYHKKHYERFRLLRYDLTPEQHKDLLNKQNNGCAICGKIPNNKRPLAVDHDHTTGQVRELLCYGCNRLMSLVDDDDKLLRFISYRDKYRKTVA